jgi:hypothetical protein
MSLTERADVFEMSEMEIKQRERELKKIEGTAKHIEINDRTIKAFKEEFGKKGLTITKEEEYPQEEFHSVAKQKEFDSLVDPSQGIRKIIESMIRQPVTIFNKQGKPEIKDALYYNGYWYGSTKRGEDLGAPFHEGSYKKPKLSFIYVDSRNPYDSKTGERRGTYKTNGIITEHYIFLSEDKQKRRKQLEDILQKATGTYKGDLERGHLHYRQPSPNNDHRGTHGGSFNWNQFCDLSIEELGECQDKRYYKEKSTGILKDKDGVRVQYDQSTGKIEAIR